MVPEIKKAYDLAVEARENSHSPYSHFKVGACFKVKNKDEYFVGTNMENASYPAGICAEQSALGSAVTNGQKKFDFAVIVTDTDQLTPPCGLCRQTMSEFCDPDMPVYLTNLKGESKSYQFKELLPASFTSFEAK